MRARLAADSMSGRSEHSEGQAWSEMAEVVMVY